MIGVAYRIDIAAGYYEAAVAVIPLTALGHTLAGLVAIVAAGAIVGGGT